MLLDRDILTLIVRTQKPGFDCLTLALEIVSRAKALVERWAVNRRGPAHGLKPGQGQSRLDPPFASESFSSR